MLKYDPVGKFFTHLPTSLRSRDGDGETGEEVDVRKKKRRTERKGYLEKRRIGRTKDKKCDKRRETRGG